MIFVFGRPPGLGGAFFYADWGLGWGRESFFRYNYVKKAAFDRSSPKVCVN